MDGMQVGSMERQGPLVDPVGASAYVNSTAAPVPAQRGLAMLVERMEQAARTTDTMAAHAEQVASRVMGYPIQPPSPETRNPAPENSLALVHFLADHIEGNLARIAQVQEALDGAL